MGRNRRVVKGALISVPRRAPRRPSIDAALFERLESRTLLAFDPSPQAQAMLEHVNRMRMNPQGELQVLLTSLSPLAARNEAADSAIKYFKDPTTASLQAEWPVLTAVAPLAWNEKLSVAATGHSQKMIQHDVQSHQLPGEPDLGDRVRQAGYEPSRVGENVYAYANNAFHAHSAFALDWAVPNRGHRVGIMRPEYRDFGVGVVATSGVGKSVGPLVVTQNFGNRFNYGNSFVVGVAYRDGNGNQRYDVGEGLANVEIRVIGPTGTFRATSMSAGGYQVQVPVGTYTVTASGGGLPSTLQTSGIRVESSNVKTDFRIGPGGLPPSQEILAGSPIAEGQWSTIKSGNRLVRMADGKVLDWVPTTGRWRLWNYDPASKGDILPGNPVAQGRWSSIGRDNRLIAMKDGRVLDWVPSTGRWRLWNYDPSAKSDILPGNPVAQGQWRSIRSGHLLTVMQDGRVLDWVPADGTWRLWNYDPTSRRDIFPGNPVAQGQWRSIRSGHLLTVMQDGRVLDWVPADGTWSLWNYDPTSSSDIFQGRPVKQGKWSSITGGHLLTVMGDGRVLDWIPSTGAWRLFNYRAW